MSLSARSRILPLWLALAAPAWAQDAGREMVLPPENVRYDYAQVLGVRPIYQVLKATGTERVCDGPVGARTGTLSRVVGAMRHRLGSEEGAAQSEGGNCRTQAVEREFRRPIAYDVDYVHHGVKYRSRLPYDPGNRLRVRVSITPIVSGSR